MNTERKEDKTNIEPPAQVERLVMSEGYCCDCKNNPTESLADASKIHGHLCNGCWFSDDKRNWEGE